METRFYFTPSYTWNSYRRANVMDEAAWERSRVQIAKCFLLGNLVALFAREKLDRRYLRQVCTTIQMKVVSIGPGFSFVRYYWFACYAEDWKRVNWFKLHIKDNQIDISVSSLIATCPYYFYLCWYLNYKLEIYMLQRLQKTIQLTYCIDTDLFMNK